MRIGELAEHSGASVTTIRYYEKLGLLPQASRNTSGYREYSRQSLDQVALIRRAKRLGFSLREIRLLLSRPRGASREAVLAAVALKLTQLERDGKALRSRERELRDLKRRVLRDSGKDDHFGTWLAHREKEEIPMTLNRTSLGHFDDSGHHVLKVAADEARRYRHSWIGTEHLLLAFAQLGDESLGGAFASDGGLGISVIRPAFEKLLAREGAPDASGDDSVVITPRVNRVMGIAEGLALSDERRATAADLLLATLQDGDGLAVGLIRACGGDPVRVAKDLQEIPS